MNCKDILGSLQKFDIQVSDPRETPRRSVLAEALAVYMVCQRFGQNLQHRRSDFLRRHHI